MIKLRHFEFQEKNISLSSEIVSLDLLRILKTINHSSSFIKKSPFPEPSLNLQFFLIISLLSVLFFNLKERHQLHYLLLNKNTEKLLSHSSSWTRPVSPKLHGNSLLFHFTINNLFIGSGDVIPVEEDGCS